MAKKQKAIRSAKKEVRRLFERSFDLHLLNYKHRTKEIKYRAMLMGLISAGVLYGIAYTIAYYGFNNNIISLEALSKVVWIVMIPTSVVGMFVWTISKNRMEYPIRAEVREYMERQEAKDGLLWRFGPIWEHFDGSVGVTKKAIAHSQEGRIEKLDIEDYTEAVGALYQILNETESKDFNNDVALAVVENFKSTAQRESQTTTD